MTDWYTDELFCVKGSDRLLHSVSRLVVDPERFPDDTDEVMAQCGLGAVYTHNSHGTPLRKSHDRDRWMHEYYFPHHERLESWTDSALAKYGQCLIIDCHSFPATPLPCDLDQSPQRPDFCIGTDEFHTPPWLPTACADLMKIVFSDGDPSQSPSLQIDQPYAGTIVPARHFRHDPRVESIMIELNRSLYMNEETGVKLPSFASTKSRLNQVLTALSEFWKNPSSS